MTEYLHITLMALFQGVAEFLPISSSGHLEVLGTVFGIQESERFTLSIVLHAGTLFAMLIFYFRDILGIFLKKQWRTIGLVIAGSVPAGIGGVSLKLLNADEYFHSLYLVGGCFLVTGGLLAMLRRIQSRETEYIPLEKLSWKSVLFIGFLQMVAILPGISRSGSTIFAGAKCKLAPEDNAKFSFFLAMAAISGAVLLEIISLCGKIENNGTTLNITHYAAGFLLSLISGYLALSLLLKLLKSQKLGYFSIYMFLAGALTIIYNIWN